jgi:hypothetical protein
MSKYLSFFSNYIHNHQVTIVSTALTGYQDISGFSGIQLHDDFSTMFFYNYCLSLSKKKLNVGYLLFIKPNQFLVPTSTATGADVDSSLFKILSSQIIDSSISPSTADHIASFKLTKKSKENDRKPFSLRSRPVYSASTAGCSFYLNSKVYGISEDPNGAVSNPYGPSDYFFFRGEWIVIFLLLLIY